MSTTRESPARPQSAVTVPAHAVVVGVDATPSSLAAVEWGATEAVARHAPLHIVHAWDWPHLAPWLTSADRTMRDQLQRAGEDLIGRYRIATRNAGADHITSEVREGAAHDLLVALSEQAALLVVGSHHLGRIARTVLGSTGRAVAEASQCPTIVVTGRKHARTRPDRVVVGISAAPTDEAVLRFAFDYAQSHELPVDVLYCWDTGDLPFSWPIPESAGAWLAESIAGWRGRYLTVPVQATVRAVHPVAGLVAAAGTDGIIVVGRREHRHPLPGSHIGSIGLGALHHAACAVAIVPA